MNIDKDIHKVFSYFKSKSTKWHDFQEIGIDDDYFDYYYAEDELYVIRDRIFDKYYFVHATSPEEARNKMWEIAEEVARSIRGDEE